MATLGERALFLSMIHREYGGCAKYEIDEKHTALEGDIKSNPERLQLSIHLLLGRPEQIGGQAVHPVEIDSIGTYDSARDGRMTGEEAFRFAFGRALDLAWPGASALIDTKRVGFPREKGR